MDDSVSYELITRAGATIRTFDERGPAIAYAKGIAETFPGLKVQRVVRKAEERFTVWTEARLRLVG